MSIQLFGTRKEELQELKKELQDALYYLKGDGKKLVDVFLATFLDFFSLILIGCLACAVLLRGIFGRGNKNS
jgi:hypothetical protein